MGDGPAGNSGRTETGSAGRRIRVGIALMSPGDGAGGRRSRLANALLPGAGLIAQGRVWQGLGLGLAFWWMLAGAFYLSWIARGMSWPGWAVGLALAAIAAYLVNQWVLARALAGLSARESACRGRVGPVLQAAYEAMGRGDWIAAQLQLDGVLVFDPENFEANLMQARLLAIQRKFDRAARAYRRCRRLDHRRRWGWEIDREMSSLPR